MERLVKMTAERGLILQVVFGMEDPRVHHPIIEVGPVALAPLWQAVRNTPDAKLELLHFSDQGQAEDLHHFMTKTSSNRKS